MKVKQTNGAPLSQNNILSKQLFLIQHLNTNTSIQIFQYQYIHQHQPYSQQNTNQTSTIWVSEERESCGD